MPSINLAPGTQYLVAAKKRRRQLYILSCIIIVICAAIWGGLFAYINGLERSKEDIDGLVNRARLEIAQMDEQAHRIVLFEQRLHTLNALLDRHVSWEPLFQDLERLLPADTVLQSLQADAGSGQMSISATTSSIDRVAQTLASLSQAENHDTLFTRAEFRSIGRSESSTEQVNEEGQAVSQTEVSYGFNATLHFSQSSLRFKE